jgi:hypothetical protein
MPIYKSSSKLLIKEVESKMNNPIFDTVTYFLFGAIHLPSPLPATAGAEH